MAKLRTHICRAEGCQHVISTRLLMCLEHWRMVPAPLRREILDLYWAGDKAAAYEEAVAKAIAAVKEKQERKAHGGPSGSLFNQA